MLFPPALRIARLIMKIQIHRPPSRLAKIDHRDSDSRISNMALFTRGIRRITTTINAPTVMSWVFIVGLLDCFGQQSVTNRVLSLDGAGDAVSIPSSPAIQNATEITVEAWLYPVKPNGSGSRFINKGDGQSGNSARTYELSWVPGPLAVEFILFLETGTYGLIDAPSSESNWVHVAATYTSASGLLQLYTNGVLAGSTTVTVVSSILRRERSLTGNT